MENELEDVGVVVEELFAQLNTERKARDDAVAKVAELEAENKRLKGTWLDACPTLEAEQAAANAKVAELEAALAANDERLIAVGLERGPDGFWDNARAKRAEAALSTERTKSAMAAWLATPDENLMIADLQTRLAKAIRERDAANARAEQAERELAASRELLDKCCDAPLKLEIAEQRYEHRIADLTRQLEQAHVDAAVMRKEIDAYLRCCPLPACDMCNYFRSAIATNAGQPLLDELARLREVVERIRIRTQAENENWEAHRLNIREWCNAALGKAVCDHCGDTGHPTDECAAMPTKGGS